MAGALAGVKVVDLSWVIVGPLTSKYLADHGAQVIRLESSLRPDLTRTDPPFKDFVPGVNNSVFWCQFNSSKESLGLDLKHPKSRIVTRRLIEWADIIISNFTPGVLESFGLGYAEASAINPGIIVLRTLGYGATGPLANQPLYGSGLAATTGFFAMTGWPDRAPWIYGAPTDLLVPRYQVATLLAALDERERTGRGASFDISHLEVSSQFVAPIVLDRLTGGPGAVERQGNRDPQAAPHGVYRCAGDDSWCAITVFDDAHWAGLCRAIGRPGLAADPRFTAAEARKRHEVVLDALVEEWTMALPADEVMSRLQEAGVPAGVVRDPPALFADPQLRQYGHWLPLQHSEIGEYFAETVGFRLSATPGAVSSAPSLGQDTFRICTETLGMTEEDVIALLEEAVLE